MERFLFLKNGRRFRGEGFGYEGDAVGELVFNTSAVGCLELLSDPVSAGQIVMQTFPMAGNYGSIAEDLRGGRLCCEGFVVREWCAEPSNFRCEGTIDQLMREHKVTGLCGIDTRELTRILREEGTMPAIITNSEQLSDEQKAKLENFAYSKCAFDVSCKESYEIAVKQDAPTVAVLDLGAADICAKALAERGVNIKVLPYNYSAEDILALNVQGVCVSDGPGRAEDEKETEDKLLKILGKVPMFGIGLGHELMAVALGGKVLKLSGGHRGANQPVRESKTGRVTITTQNHGYAVSEVPVGGSVTHRNEHDGSIEGLEYNALRAFSIAYAPCTDGGVNDSGSLYDKFIELVGGAK